METKEPSPVLWDDLQGFLWEGGKEAQEGGDICIHMADSCCCIAETNTTF